MSKRAGFVGLLPPKQTQPPTSYRGSPLRKTIIRDQLSISSWICLGAITQGLAFWLLGPIALLPAALLAGLRMLDTLIVVIGLKHNYHMDSIITTKFSAQFPDDEGRYGNQPAATDVVVFLIGTRTNHPLGMLAPGTSTIFAYFASMEKDLSTHSDEFGFLGMRICLDAADRQTGSETVAVCYFKTVEGLHAFAHSPYHREGWDWYTKTAKSVPHISIYHETYHVPKGNWENIYLNSHTSGITSTAHKYFDQERGVEMWASPVVDASKGVLKTSAGRMARSEGKEHEKYGL